MSPAEPANSFDYFIFLFQVFYPLSIQAIKACGQYEKEKYSSFSVQ